MINRKVEMRQKLDFHFSLVLFINTTFTTALSYDHITAKIKVLF